MANLAMFIDGVLRSHQGTPIPQGMSLYKTLNAHHKIFLLSSQKARDERWLKEHKMFNFDNVIGPDIPGVTDDVAFRQVEFCRSAEGQFGMAVTSDPALVTKLLKVGITSLLFAHPSYMKEEFRPDGRQGVKSWSDIVSEIELQQEKYKDDPRLQ